MSADILYRLAAADPATAMPEITAADDERLLAELFAAQPRTQPPQTPRWRRFRWVALVGAAFVLIGGAAYGAEYGLPSLPTSDDPDGVTWEQARDEYDEWTKKLELPAGASWHEFERPWDDASMGGYGAAWGAMDAIEQAIGRWAQEWIAAAKTRDPQRAVAAETWLRRLRAVMEPIREGHSENEAGYDQSILDELDAAIAAARHGRFEPLNGFTGWARPRHYATRPEVYRGTKYDVRWIGDLPDGLSVDELNALRISGSEAGAEYASVLGMIGLPQAAEWRDWPPSNDWRMKGDGYQAAVDYAWAAWWREWVAAAEAGDRERIVAAEAASARLHDLISRRWPSDPAAEEWVSLDARTLRDFERLDAAARQGDMQGIQDWLDFQEWYRERIREAAGY